MPVYVVVGATKNLGLAYVREIAKNPSNVVYALARDLNNASELIAFSKEHTNVHLLKLDLVDLDSIKAAAKAISDATGGVIDYLIHSGAILMHPSARLSLDTFPNEKELDDYMIDSFRTNTLGAIHTINAFLPLLLKGQTKKIIVVSSRLGLPAHTLKTQSESATAYSVSKAALNIVVTKFAVTPSLKEKGLIIVGVEPGFMKSYTFPGSEEYYAATVAKMQKIIPDFKLVPHEESARYQIELLTKLTAADSGSFLMYDGTPLPL